MSDRGHVCKWCGAQFVGHKRKYCTPGCKGKARHKRDGSIRKRERSDNGRTCVSCGGILKGEQKRFCSIECARVGIAKERQKDSFCKKCGRELVPGEGYYHNSKVRTGLCDSCLYPPKSAADLAVERLHQIVAVITTVVSGPPTCRRCGMEIEKKGPLCPGCAERAKQAKIARICRRQNDRYKADPIFRLRKRMRNFTGACLRGEKHGRHWEALVGYSLDDLRAHLEKKFKPGMTWDNYGREWHIDHIIPLSRLNITSAESPDFRRAWALGNLQPLWAKENISKGNKLCKPVQPSLSL